MRHRILVFCKFQATSKNSPFGILAYLLPQLFLLKHRNTQSIPVFSKLNLSQKLSPKSSKKSF